VVREENDVSTEHGQVISIHEERLARGREQRERCHATTAEGQPCRNYAVHDGYCRIHAPEPPAERPDVLEERRPSGGIELLEGLRDVLGEEWLDHIRDVPRSCGGGSPATTSSTSSGSTRTSRAT
jgi:hypothetical protein